MIVECAGEWRYAGTAEDGEGGEVTRFRCSGCGEEMLIANGRRVASRPAPRKVSR